MYLDLFREKLVANAGSKQIISEFLQDELSLTKDGAYRRLRGETAFHFDEIAILANKFNISLNEIVQPKSHSIGMKFYPLVLHNTDYFDILNKSFDSLENVEAIASIKKVGMYYYGIRSLMYFNAVYFNKVVNGMGFEQDKFSVKHLQQKIGVIDHIRSLGLEIFYKYLNMPSVEIFGPNSFDNMLMRIKYAVDCGFFSSKEDALNICHDVRRIIEHLDLQAAKGLKLDMDNQEKEKAPFTMYYYDESQLDNIILFNSEAGSKLLTILNMGDIMITEDVQMTERLKGYLQNILKLSEKISGENERGRNRVFSFYKNKLGDLEKYVEAGFHKHR